MGESLKRKRKANTFTGEEAAHIRSEASPKPLTLTEPRNDTTPLPNAGVTVADTTSQSQLLASREGPNQPSSSQPRWTEEPPRGLAALTAAGIPGDVAEPPCIKDAASRDRPLPADLDPVREMALRTFWALLEEWV